MKKIIIAIFFLASVNLSAETYVSFKGGFYFEYPENWIQIDYNTADLFLSRSATDPSSMEYEAVFAPAESSPFFAGEYLILKLDTLEWLYEYKEDSIVEAVEASLGQKLLKTSVWDHLADTNSMVPVYDTENKIIFIQSDLTQGIEIIKRSIFIKKMYDKGVAEFYFFAPLETFESSKEVFKNIVMSFSTENVDQALPTEKLKVAEFDDDSDDSRTIMIALAAALLIIIAVIVRLKMAAKRKEE
ncbi:MAG: hypothetical protein IH931_08415 [candidate division Zixibacteria bacterium]|nr:hypothetical protein [candidate division Zixibacteria bacterium]